MHPEPFSCLVTEELPFPARVLHADVIPLAEHTGDGLVVFLVAQRLRHIDGHPALIGHDASPRFVVERLVHDGEALVRALLHAPRRDVPDLVSAHGGHVHRMDDVLLEERRHAEVVDAAGPRPVRAA